MSTGQEWIKDWWGERESGIVSWLHTRTQVGRFECHGSVGGPVERRSPTVATSCFGYKILNNRQKFAIDMSR